MITLYQPPPAWGIPSISPFCLKLETYLRMTDTPYVIKPPRATLGPKGKIPYIRDGELVMGDSGMIVEHLRRTRGDALDAHLTPAQRATGHLLRRTLEEHAYFVVAFLRWKSALAWPHLQDAFRPFMPKLIFGFIMGRIRKGMLAPAHAQGAGRHTDAELLEQLAADLAAIDAVLGDGPFLFGERPTSFDATLYGFFAQLAYVPWEGDEQRMFRAMPRLMAYVERMKARDWSDWTPESARPRPSA